MQKVKINFENCFGIKRFRETLNFQEHKCVPCLHELREKQKAAFPYDLYEC